MEPSRTLDCRFPPGHGPAFGLASHPTSNPQTADEMAGSNTGHKRGQCKKNLPPTGIPGRAFHLPTKVETTVPPDGPIWDTLTSMGENPGSFIWSIQTRDRPVAVHVSCRLCNWWRANPQGYELLHHCHRCPERQEDYFWPHEPYILEYTQPTRRRPARGQLGNITYALQPDRLISNWAVGTHVSPLTFAQMPKHTSTLESDQSPSQPGAAAARNRRPPTAGRGVQVLTCGDTLSQLGPIPSEEDKLDHRTGRGSNLLSCGDIESNPDPRMKKTSPRSYPSHRQRARSTVHSPPVRTPRDQPKGGAQRYRLSPMWKTTMSRKGQYPAKVGSNS